MCTPKIDGDSGAIGFQSTDQNGAFGLEQPDLSVPPGSLSRHGSDPDVLSSLASPIYYYPVSYRHETCSGEEEWRRSEKQGRAFYLLIWIGLRCTHGPGPERRKQGENAPRPVPS